MTMIDLRNWEGWRTEPRDKRGRWTRGEVEKAVKAIVSEGARAKAGQAVPGKTVVPKAAASRPVKPSDLKVRASGAVISKKTGAEVGVISVAPGGRFIATHPDGSITRHGSLPDAVAAVASTAASAKPLQKGDLPLSEKRNLVGLWTNAFRYSNESYVGGKEGKDFTSEMHRLLATNTPPKTCGKGCQEAHKFLGMIDHDAKPQSKEMQRGITLSSADVKRMFQPGKEIDMPVASWTTKPEWAASFADKNFGPDSSKVVLHTAPGAKGLDLANTSLFSEGEVVTGGRLSVDRVQTVDGVTHVYMTQKDFSAH
jgi:hypothetical protein